MISSTTPLESTPRTARRAIAPKRTATPTASRRKTVKANHVRQFNQILAGVAASFLPVASYALAHFEAKEYTYLYALVIASLCYSAPTLAAWAKMFTGNAVKAWGFTILLEGVMVLSHMAGLSYTGLALLVLINGMNAYAKMGKALRAAAAKS